MERDKLYRKTLTSLNKADNMNELELAQQVFGERIIAIEQLHTIYETIAELLKKGLITKTERLNSRDRTDHGHVVDIIDNRFSISIDGITYLRSSSNNRIFIWITTNKQIIVIISSIVALGLSALGLYLSNR